MGTDPEGFDGEDFDDTLDRYYDDGFEAGFRAARQMKGRADRRKTSGRMHAKAPAPKKKRKPSAYNKFVKEMSKKPRFRYKQTRGNKKKGMVNMKAIAQAWKKKRKR